MADRSADVVLLIDVLHHTDHAVELLGEASRVAREAVIIKDHTLQGWLATPTLRLMDHVGNARHGVSLPFNYWTVERWTRAWAELGMSPRRRLADLRLYPRPADWVFGRSLHLLVELIPSAPGGGGRQASNSEVEA